MKVGTNRLKGAEFLVKKAKDEYLVKKVATESEKTAVTTKKKELDEKVTAYNNLTADQQNGEEGTKAKEAIAKAQKAYNDAVLASATKYVWTTVEAYNKTQTEDAKKVKEAKSIPNIVKLSSKDEGKFEITGLAYGEYKLEEITPPAGFAKLSGDQEFTVAKGSYAGDAKEFKYEKEVKAGETQHYGLQIKNKKVSIPQTGGIGTIIFTAIGLAIMASAVIAIKKRQATEAR